jgi:hypothetical protein
MLGFLLTFAPLFALALACLCGRFVGEERILRRLKRAGTRIRAARRLGRLHRSIAVRSLLEGLRCRVVDRRSRRDARRAQAATG